MTTLKVAVLGLGAMGLPMAHNLASKGFQVNGFDPQEARSALLQPPSVVKPSASAAARDGDVVLLAVRNHAQLLEVLWGEEGVVPVLAPGAAVLLTSTVGIEAVRDVAARLETHGLHLVDAPVSGGPARAGEGDLLVTVGATDTAWDATSPVLDAMASRLVRVGSAAGDGQAMKTVNQLLCGVHIAAAAEALALAEALGLDPELALETLGAGAAASFMLSDRGPRMLQAYDEGGAEVRSRLDIFVKDMGIVTAAAKTANVPAPLAAAAEQVYLLGEAHGDAGADDSSIITLFAPSSRRAGPAT